MGNGERVEVAVFENIYHAPVGQSPDDPVAHMHVREAKGIRPGGFGLLMVRASVDELIYNEKRNEVVFVKYLDGAADGQPQPRPSRRK